MTEDFYHKNFNYQSSKTLVEAVDGQNRPLCLLPVEEARAQKLLLRSAALVAQDGSGRFLLGLDPEDRPGFIFSGLIPAGQSYAASCEKILAERWGTILSSADLLGVWQPCPENDNTFAGICQLALSSAILENLARADPRCIAADQAAITAFDKGSCGLSPFFRLVHASGLFNGARIT